VRTGRTFLTGKTDCRRWINLDDKGNFFVCLASHK